MYFGEKIILRAHQKEDIELAANFLNDYEVKKLKTPGTIFPSTYEETEEFFLNKYTKNKESRYGFAIATKDTNEYIGWCGYLNLNRMNNVAEIGIAIGNKSYWGKGYGTDALNILLRFLFNELNVRKISLDVHDFNERAINSYKKVGFKEEGRLRQEGYVGGEYCDIVKMGLFRQEFVDPSKNLH
jgi:RimJ/RimL family protein N-acetyltransferase